MKDRVGRYALVKSLTREASWVICMAFPKKVRSWRRAPIQSGTPTECYCHLLDQEQYLVGPQSVRAETMADWALLRGAADDATLSDW